MTGTGGSSNAATAPPATTATPAPLPPSRSVKSVVESMREATSDDAWAPAVAMQSAVMGLSMHALRTAADSYSVETAGGAKAEDLRRQLANLAGTGVASHDAGEVASKLAKLIEGSLRFFVRTASQAVAEDMSDTLGALGLEVHPQIPKLAVKPLVKVFPAKSDAADQYETSVSEIKANFEALRKQIDEMESISANLTHTAADRAISLYEEAKKRHEEQNLFVLKTAITLRNADRALAPH